VNSVIRRFSADDCRIGSNKKAEMKKQHTASKATPARLTKPSRDSTDSLTRWTFLTNHAHVLAVLHSDPQLVLRQVAIEVGITERAVQRIILDLEEGGFIQREKVGRQNRYQVLTNQSLRHPIEAHRKIGDLLKLINK
jgi:DNA-binding MarR family transcriptional regulator